MTKDVLSSLLAVVVGIGALWLPHTRVTIYYPHSRTPMPHGRALVVSVIVGLTCIVTGIVSLWHTLHTH